MSLFNRSRSSQQSTTNNTENTISTVDNRVSEGNARVGGNVSVNPGDINGSLTISTTDQGAIQGGVDIALESLRGIQNALTTTQDSAKDNISQAYNLANQARQSETSGAINNFLKYGVWIALAGIAAFAIVKYGK